MHAEVLIREWTQESCPLFGRTKMDENLVGYLLKALDADTEREVESYLRGNLQAQRKLELLKQALEPLEADREEIRPPAGLRMRALARVAERLPVPPPILRAAPVSCWPRADVLVAACLLIVCLPLLLPLLTAAHRAYKRQQCENNLREMWGGLMVYSDHHHGDLPKVEDEPPRNFAGVYVPILSQDGLLQQVSVACPATGASPLLPISMDELNT